MTQDACLVPLPATLLFRRPLVVFFLSLGEADGKLRPPPGPVKVKRHQSVAGSLDLSYQCGKLMPLQKQLAGTCWIRLYVAGRLQHGYDVGAEKPRFAVSQDHIRFRYLCFSQPQALDFPTEEYNASLRRALDGIVEARPPILSDLPRCGVLALVRRHHVIIGAVDPPVRFGAMAQVEVAYGTSDEQVLLTVALLGGECARDAIAASGLLERYPNLTLNSLEIGIFGRRVSLESPVSDGDRIEVYRPLVRDPKQARRSRAGDRTTRSAKKKKP